MIVITGSVSVRPECRDQALALGVEHSVRSRGEAGCLAHNCHVDAEDANRVVFVELWQDLAAVQRHFAVPASGEFVRALGAMAEAPPQMQVYNATAVERLGL